MTTAEKKDKYKAILRASMMQASMRPDLYDVKDTVERLIKIYPGDEELILEGWGEVQK